LRFCFFLKKKIFKGKGHYKGNQGVVNEDVVIDKHSSVQEKLGKMLTFCGTKIYALI